MPDRDSNPDSSPKGEMEVETVREENEALKDDVKRLDEELKLQKTNWLFSHHFAFSALLGTALGFLVPLLTIALEYLFSLQSFYKETLKPSYLPL